MKSILLAYARPQQKDTTPKLIYDWHSAMNYILNAGKKLLFIENSSSVLALMTKTESHRESDQSDSTSVLNLMTKTRHECEHEDTADTYCFA